jgi:hypothetical protein
VYEIFGLTINFIRQGLYLGPISSDTDAAATNPNILIASPSAELKTPGPTKVSITLSDSTDGLTDGFLVVSDFHTDDIALIAAKDLSGSPSTVDESAKYAYGGTVVDVAATTTNPFLYSHTFSSPLTGYDTLLFLASVRNVSTIQTWLMRIKTENQGLETTSRWIRVNTATTNPRYLNFGTISHAGGIFTKFTLEIQTYDVDVSENIRVDTIACIPYGRNTRVIRIRENGVRDLGAATTMVFDHRALTATSAIAKFVAGSTESHMSGMSHAYLETSGENVAALFLATKGANWTFLNDANNAKQTTALSVERYTSYLVPQ